MIRIEPFRRASLSMLVGVCALAASAQADIFVLDGPGVVRGELVNRDESPRKSYVVKTSSGGLVTLTAEQVKEVKRQSAAEVKYDKTRADYPDTVEGQWKLAEWCREHKLTKSRKVHLERLIQLDPDHEQARHGLGYSQVNGRWVTRGQYMEENGYVRSKYAPGKWVLPQEEEVLAEQSKGTKSQREWFAKLKKWSAWFGTARAGEAEANLKAIDDPYAATALGKYLASEKRSDVRMLYVEALGRLDSASAMESLINASLWDADEEIRIASVDQVVARQYKPAVVKYVQSLKSKDNAVVNRAAECLAKLKDPSAIGPLIDALVTTHTFHVQKGQPGQTTTSFGSGGGGGGGGFTFGGGGTEIIKQRFENRSVLQALVELTDGTSFNFDHKAWKYWYASQKRPHTLDARRDGASSK